MSVLVCLFWYGNKDWYDMIWLKKSIGYLATVIPVRSVRRLYKENKGFSRGLLDIWLLVYQVITKDDASFLKLMLCRF